MAKWPLSQRGEDLDNEWRQKQSMRELKGTNTKAELKAEIMAQMKETKQNG